jgi:hypothetical protein
MISDWMWCSMIKLSIRFIEKYKNKLDWFYISRSQKLNKNFIIKYHENLYWSEIGASQILDNELINMFHYKLNWMDISYCQKLSENIIIKYKNNVNWFGISKCQKLSEEFIDKYSTRLSLFNVFYNSNNIFSKNFLKKYLRYSTCYSYCNILNRYYLKILCNNNNLFHDLVNYINDFL